MRRAATPKITSIVCNSELRDQGLARWSIRRHTGLILDTAVDNSNGSTEGLHGFIFFLAKFALKFLMSKKFLPY